MTTSGRQASDLLKSFMATVYERMSDVVTSDEKQLKNVDDITGFNVCFSPGKQAKNGFVWFEAGIYPAVPGRALITKDEEGNEVERSTIMLNVSSTCCFFHYFANDSEANFVKDKLDLLMRARALAEELVKQVPENLKEFDHVVRTAAWLKESEKMQRHSLNQSHAYHTVVKAKGPPRKYNQVGRVLDCTGESAEALDPGTYEVKLGKQTWNVTKIATIVTAKRLK